MKSRATHPCAAWPIQGHRSAPGRAGLSRSGLAQRIVVPRAATTILLAGRCRSVPATQENGSRGVETRAESRLPGDWREASRGTRHRRPPARQRPPQRLESGRRHGEHPFQTTSQPPDAGRTGVRKTTDPAQPCSHHSQNSQSDRNLASQRALCPSPPHDSPSQGAIHGAPHGRCL